MVVGSRGGCWEAAGGHLVLARRSSIPVAIPASVESETVSLGEGIDATTPAGKLQMHILGAIAEFERGRVVERLRAGLARAKAQGKRLGRHPYAIADERFDAVAHLSRRNATQELGVSRSVVHRGGCHVNLLIRRPVYTQNPQQFARPLHEANVSRRHLSTRQHPEPP